jgi:hypothetical protein
MAKFSSEMAGVLSDDDGAGLLLWARTDENKQNVSAKAKIDRLAVGRRSLFMDSIICVSLNRVSRSQLYYGSEKIIAYDETWPT